MSSATQGKKELTESFVPTDREVYPVVDLFAGPGGLGEGFASLEGSDGAAVFKSVVSIEQDEHAFETLRLRHFLRAFGRSEFPDEYHFYLSGDISLRELYGLYPGEKEHADRSALRISLGPATHDSVRTLIKDRIKDRGRWALVGGPPCQAYSLVGRSRMMRDPEFEKDVRHFLYKEYLRIIIDHAPPVFVMENVKGLLSAKVGGELVINRILADLASPRAALGGGQNGLAYKLYSLGHDQEADVQSDPRVFLIRSEDYGVPQNRHRMFIVGVREDIDVAPGQLQPDEPPTVRQMIGDLPKIRSGLSRSADSLEAWLREIRQLDLSMVRRKLNGYEYAPELLDAISTSFDCDVPRLNRISAKYPSAPSRKHPVLQSVYDSGLSVLTGHEARSHMASDLRRYAFAAWFANVTGRSPMLSDFPPALLPDHKNIALGKQGKMFADRFRVQLADAPSTTITSHISKDGHYFIHYDPIQCRSLTVREAARLQTFPDNYKFEGPRTSQYHQVGNAVPPYLAKQIAEIVEQVLDAVKEKS
ncbi:MAG: DNA cytosine methyltransferase [Gammaproteobacteria bacterium]